MPPTRRRRATRSIFVAALAFGAWASPAHAARDVLVLYDERGELPGLATLDAALRSELAGTAGEPVEVYRESLDASRFDAKAHRQLFADYLRGKYSDGRIEVVVAVMGPALDFLLEHREDLFPGLPIVFCGIDHRELGDRALPAGVTGVLLRREFAPTVEIALALQPETERAILVSGTSAFDVAVREQAVEELRAFEGRLAIEDWSARPFPDILRAAEALPPHTIVLFASMFRDAAATAFIPHEAAAQLSAAANAPVYGFVDQFLGRGIVGGRLYSLEAHGGHAARLVQRILAGADLAKLPPVEPSSSVLRFDARQLERWGLDQRRLPEGAVVLHRSRTLWGDFRNEVVGVVVVFILLLGLIAALVTEGARKRRAETSLRESELRFRTLADSTQALLWLSDPDDRLTFVNRRWLELTGSTREAQAGRPWPDQVHPDDLGKVPRHRGGPGRVDYAATFECRLRQANGEHRWFLVTRVPRFDSADTFLGYVGSCVDINAQKEADRETQRSRAALMHVARVATMGELTAAVAHELKQPLGAILANAEAADMLLGAATPDLTELREILADIRADDRRAADIIDRMRSLLEKHELAKVPIAVNETAWQVLRLLDLEATERQVELRFEPAPDLPPVAGDRVHLQQVLMNLVLNGLEAMAAVPPGRRELHVRTAKLDGAKVSIVVTDSGGGIPEEQLPWLFEPFWTTKDHGLGMGLSIARTIVESHDGRIWVENVAGGGARFHVELPALLATAATSAPRATG